MKPRKVIIIIEARTDMPLKELRSIWRAIPDADYWHDVGCEFEVHQVNVQAVKTRGRYGTIRSDSKTKLYPMKEGK